MGWSELLLIGVVALIVVGPKDLPVMFQSLGRMTAKVKRMAREFSRAMEDAADSTGMKDVAKDLNKTMSPKSMGIDKLREAADRFDKWEPTKAAEKKPVGPATQKLSEERAEAKRKIQEASAKAAEERKAREAAVAASEAAELSEEPEVNGAETAPAPKAAPAKKAAAKKAAPKAPAKKAAPKAAAKKPAAKPAAAKKTTAKSKTKPEASGDAGVS